MHFALFLHFANKIDFMEEGLYVKYLKPWQQNQIEMEVLKLP